jgi:hypothetical protein
MELSGLSDNGLALMATQMSATQTQNKVQMQVMKLANDQLKQDGAVALQLIASTPYGPLGHHLDVTA